MVFVERCLHQVQKWSSSNISSLKWSSSNPKRIFVENIFIQNGLRLKKWSSSVMDLHPKRSSFGKMVSVGHGPSSEMVLVRKNCLHRSWTFAINCLRRMGLHRNSLRWSGLRRNSLRRTYRRWNGLCRSGLHRNSLRRTYRRRNGLRQKYLRRNQLRAIGFHPEDN